MAMFRKDMSVGLRWDEVACDDLDENLFQILFVVPIAKLRQDAFRKKLAVMDDADGVAELFDFAHDVCGEDDGLAVVATFADERRDCASGHDIEAGSGLIEDHDRWIVNEGASAGSFLLHAGGELVAGAVAEAVHIQAVEDIVDALFESGFVQAIEAAEVFDHFLRAQAGIESGGGREKADIGADLFRLFDDVVAANDRRAVGGLKDGGEHAQGSCLAGAVGAEKAVNPAGLASESDVIDGTDFAALFVMEALGQGTGFNHRRTP